MEQSQNPGPALPVQQRKGSHSGRSWKNQSLTSRSCQAVLPGHRKDKTKAHLRHLFNKCLALHQRATSAWEADLY